VVFRSSLREADARISDKVTLYLPYSYLGYTTINELDNAVTLTGKDPNIYNLPKAVEERLELILSYIIRKTANEDSYIVRVGDLIYRLYSIKRSGLVILRWNALARITSESLSNP